MKKNMGSADRIIRLLAAVAIAVLYFTDVISGTIAIILGIIALAFLITGSVGSCPGYIPMGISTIKKEDS